MLVVPNTLAAPHVVLLRVDMVRIALNGLTAKVADVGRLRILPIDALVVLLGGADKNSAMGVKPHNRASGFNVDCLSHKWLI